MIIPKFKKFNIRSYRPGKSNLTNIRHAIKLSANESALGMSPKVKKILFKGNVDISRYPDNNSKKLREQISKKYKCDFDKIVCGAGSDEIIQMICQLYLKANDEVIVPKYSFLMYRIYAKIVGAKVVFAKENKFKVSVTEIIKKVTKKTKIVFLANPNNPTGTYLDKRELIDLRKKLDKKILLVLDDAYFEYMDKKSYKSGLDLFKHKSNVMILRTFSKIYGLAALRIGWGYGPKEIIDEIYKIKPPFNVNQLGQFAAKESLKDNTFVNKAVKHNLKWARIIQKNLSDLKISTNEVSANFFLLDFNKCSLNANYVFKKLQLKGIILRSTHLDYNIKNKLRLTIGSAKQNLKFLKEINYLFKKK